MAARYPRAETGGRPPTGTRDLGWTTWTPVCPPADVRTCTVPEDRRADGGSRAMSSKAQRLRPIALASIGEIESELMTTVADHIRAVLGRDVVLAEGLPIPAHSLARQHRGHPRAGPHIRTRALLTATLRDVVLQHARRDGQEGPPPMP